MFLLIANRPKIANKQCQLICLHIHCNSVKSFQPFGNRNIRHGAIPSDLNLEVAKERTLLF
jgi:N-acetylmuramoyl-L-alanine amidase